MKKLGKKLHSYKGTIEAYAGCDWYGPTCDHTTGGYVYDYLNKSR
ncbi:CLI_3235 family bacteriocin precursor [Ruminiclostridium josui]|nr:CLI_3235 family bacteriocin precursor [Ruminiclostridium josui]